MTAAELWHAYQAASGRSGDDYSAWAFGGQPELLASLVLRGEKTATSSAFDMYAADGEQLPRVGESSVILDGHDNAVCVIRTTAVYVVPFDEVSATHARREGEGDKSLEYWRKVHEAFFAAELKTVNLPFDRKTLVVCEEFVVVFAP